MYEIATKSATTIQLDPPGGSENYHEYPWDGILELVFNNSDK